MHHLPLLQDILIILSCSLVVVLALQRLRLPPILGFLLTGILIGPYGLSLVYAMHEVEQLAEIGVILLLFVIGMELSLKQLLAIRKTVFVGGGLQVGLTVLLSAAVYWALGRSWPEAIFVGFLFSLSSTAIVLKILQDRNEINTPHGRNALGILIFQDIIVVPMMLLAPILAGQSTDVGAALLDLLLKSLLVVAVTFVSARYLVPRLLYAVAKTRSKELFLMTTIALCFAVAFLTSAVGLSLALGAFLAGLIVSESEYSHQATSIILPFRELFTSFFFISVGMLLDLGFFAQHIGTISALVLAVFLLKSLVASAAVAVLRYPPSTVLLTGLALWQIGEFAFILSKVGLKYELLDEATNQYFLSASIVSMMLTPFVLMSADRIVRRLLPKALRERQAAVDSSPMTTAGLDKHLVIIGYGLNGRNVAKAARHSGIPHAIIEFNAQTVRQEAAKGRPILFGDGAEEHVLAAAHVDKARVVVIAISDAAATREVLRSVRHISPSAYVIVRTRYVKEIDELIALGADEVIPEEFETSIEIFSRTLHQFLVPMDDVEELVARIRADNYQLFLPEDKIPRTLRTAKIPDFKVTCMRLVADSGPVIGRSIGEADLRSRYGISVLALARDGQMLGQIGPDTLLQQGDVVYVSGEQAQIDAFYAAVH